MDGSSKRITAVLGAAVLGAALATAVAAGEKHGPSEQEWAADYAEWLEARQARLRDEEGWLTIVGLEWLSDGDNTVGAAESNDIVLPGGPDHWGVVHLAGDTITFRRADDPAVTVDGDTPAEIELIADKAGTPNVVTADRVSFWVIHRGSYALRVRDRDAATLKNFTGVERFEPDFSWAVTGRFEPAAPGTTIEMANILGQIQDQPVGGTFHFERDGKAHSLLALQFEGAEDLWFIIADRTSGKQSYGAGRYLYSNGLPEDGFLTVDFNKAYNPPCTFSEATTCELPPQQNRLDLRVTAGEKDYKH